MHLPIAVLLYLISLSFADEICDPWTVFSVSKSFSSCIPCAAGSIVAPDSKSCLKCNQNASTVVLPPGIAEDTLSSDVNCTCPPASRSFHQLNGASLGAVFCLPCENCNAVSCTSTPGHTVSTDASTVPTSSDGCVCKTGFSGILRSSFVDVYAKNVIDAYVAVQMKDVVAPLFRKSDLICVEATAGMPAAYLNMERSSVPLSDGTRKDSEVIQLLLFVAASGCANGDAALCRSLLSLCALQQYGSSRTACRWRDALMPQSDELQRLSGIENDLSNAEIPASFFPPEFAVNGIGSRLLFQLKRYSIYGEFLGFSPYSSELMTLCPLYSADMEYLLRSGVQGKVSCEVDLQAFFASVSSQDFSNPVPFFELYLQRDTQRASTRRTTSSSNADDDLGSLVLIPIIVYNERGSCDPDGATFRSQFWTFDPISLGVSYDEVSYVRYIRSLSVEVHLHVDGVIDTPHICVRYDEAEGAPQIPNQRYFEIFNANRSLSPPTFLRGHRSNIYTTQHFTSTWEGESPDAYESLVATGTLVATFCGLAALVSSFAFCRRRRRSVVSLNIFVTGPGVSGEYLLSSTEKNGQKTWTSASGGSVEYDGAKWVICGFGAAPPQTVPDGEDAPPPPPPSLEVMYVSSPTGGGGGAGGIIRHTPVRPPMHCAPWLFPTGERSGVYVTAPSSLFQIFDVEGMVIFLETLCEAGGSLLFIMVWLASCAYYLEYKHNTNPRITRALPEGLGELFPVVHTMLWAKLFYLLVAYIRQSRIDVVLVDWEVTQEVSVSMWRRVLAANEIFRLGSARSSRTLWTIVWCLWLMYGMGFIALTTADPTLKTAHRSNYGIPVSVHAPNSDTKSAEMRTGTSPILRICILTFSLLFASFIWSALNQFAHWVIIEAPLKRLPDLLAQCNVSVLFVVHSGWGYYIHGRKAVSGREGWDRADRSLAEWQAEQQASGGVEGYAMQMPPSREFEMFLGEGIVTKMGATLLAERSGGVGGVDVAWRGGGGGAGGVGGGQGRGQLQQYARPKKCFEILALFNPPPSALLNASQAQLAENEAVELELKTMLEQAFVEAVPKFPFSIFGMFALPPPNPFAPMTFIPPNMPGGGGGGGGVNQGAHNAQARSDKHSIQLYTEPCFNVHDSWAERVTLLGADTRLHYAEMVAFVALDALIANLWLSALIVLVTMLFGIALKRRGLASRLGRQALDTRLLVM